MQTMLTVTYLTNGKEKKGILAGLMIRRKMTPNEADHSASHGWDNIWQALDLSESQFYLTGNF